MPTPDVTSTNAPETPTEPQTNTDGNTTAALEPYVDAQGRVEGTILPPDPTTPLGCHSPVRRVRRPRDPNLPKPQSGPRKPWKRISEPMKNYLKSYGVEVEKYSPAELQFFFEYATFFNKPIVLGFALRTGVAAMEDAQRALKWARETLEKSDSEAPTEMKALAANLITECGKTIAKLSRQVLDTADKSDSSGPRPTPQNKPPQFNLQVNVAPAAPVANNGAPQALPDRPPA